MKKKTVLILIGILLAVPFIPIPTGVFRDGGTRTYSAMAYKLVIWNRLTENGIYHKVSIYWFPDSLKGIDELWIREYGKQDRDIFNRAAGKTYMWEKGGFPADFGITLNADGLFATDVCKLTGGIRHTENDVALAVLCDLDVGSIPTVVDGEGGRALGIGHSVADVDEHRRGTLDTTGYCLAVGIDNLNP